jgi:uncharacterized protein YdaU (DUF1376 family)
MAQLPVMPLYTDALIADTTHLTAAEFGAYMLLLIAMWRSGGSLPDVEADIRRISRIRDNHWDRSRDRIFALFAREDGRLTQKRLQAEFEKSTERHERRSAAGRKGGKKPSKEAAQGLPTRPTYKAPLQDTPTRTPYSGAKSLKTLDPVKAMLSDSLKQTDCNTPLNYELVKEEERETIVSPKKKVLPKRGGRIPDDWAPSDADRMYAASKGLPPARVDREAEAFRNYWMAVAGERGVKVDWPATWRNWILNAIERKPEATAKAQPTGWSLPAQSPGRRT